MKLNFAINNRISIAIEPTKIILLSFLFVIALGAFLLNLPIATTSRESAGFFVALFTATSATCVTGLVLVDTGTYWSLFGQIVILCLIQIGALGVVTLTTFFSLLLGRRVGLRSMLLVQESINHFSFAGVLKIIKRILIVFFIIQLIGAIILSFRFWGDFGAKGIYLGIFHSISAFANAGFDVMGNYSSLTAYNTDPVVIYTISFLVITGGLGFIVWRDLYEYKREKSFCLHTKLVFFLVGLLLTLGTILILVFEYNNPETLGNLTFIEKVNSAFFHSMSTRTAGFNTINLGESFEITKAFSVLLMFIGAGSGSTGGGIKITTFGVILMAIVSQIRGYDDTVIFKQRIPHSIINKALAIVGLAAILVLSLSAIMLVVEDKPFIDILFESTSAFNTVGLSTIGTPTLSNISKFFIMISMFIGRIGPFTFAIALSLKSVKKTPDIVYPNAKITVG